MNILRNLRWGACLGAAATLLSLTQVPYTCAAVSAAAAAFLGWLFELPGVTAGLGWAGLGAAALSAVMYAFLRDGAGFSYPTDVYAALASKGALMISAGTGAFGGVLLAASFFL